MINNISIINEKNISDIELIKKLEQKTKTNLTSKINETCFNEIQNQTKNEFQTMLYLKTKQKTIENACLISIKKDIRCATIEIASFSKKNKIDIFLKSIEEYLFNIIDTYEIFIKTDDNNDTRKYLKEKGYEDLGKEKKDHIYMKEKQQKEMMVHIL